MLPLPPNFNVGCLWSKNQTAPVAIPLDLRDALAPADYCLYEWVDYWLQYPAADRLRVGETWLTPVYDTLFALRFENQLGLVAVQPFSGARPLCAPRHVEVISPKFPTPTAHLNFLRALVDDLYRRAARLPFTLSASAQRGVTHSQALPTPLFTLHFLLAYTPLLQAALRTIQAAPHRELRDESQWTRLAEATAADADTLTSILHTSDAWVPAPGLAFAKRLGGRAPAQVWQRNALETYDTPENRFVLALLRALATATTQLTRQAWWRKVSPERQRQIQAADSLLREAIMQPCFADVGELQRLPTSSQTLLRRDGYRDLLHLWQIFQNARQPWFARLQQAIDLRDIALLYEIWTFFALAETIADTTGEAPLLDLQVSDARGLEWQAAAHFGTGATLVYNQAVKAYSTTFRPDFTWRRAGRTEVVLDAKFRLERRTLDAGGLNASIEDDTPQAAARRADLYKMHTYRDALGVRAAVTLYPGDTSIFYDTEQGYSTHPSLHDLLWGQLAGIGAFALSP